MLHSSIYSILSCAVRLLFNEWGSHKSHGKGKYFPLAIAEGSKYVCFLLAGLYKMSSRWAGIISLEGKYKIFQPQPTMNNMCFSFSPERLFISSKNAKSEIQI